MMQLLKGHIAPGRALALAAALIVSLAAPHAAIAQAASLEEATAQVKTDNPGCRVLKADRIQRSDGSEVFKLKVLTADGTVRTVRVPAGQAKRNN